MLIATSGPSALEALAHAYPRTRWLVLRQDALREVSCEINVQKRFRLTAEMPGSGRQTSVDVPFTLVVDEELFDLVVALGREIERLLETVVK